jgi:Flp pilus assembly protein TadD
MTESREDRAKEAVRSFEERRDAAQLEAALDRWKQGDVQRAEAMLSALVSRRPDYANARMLLAEILWSGNDPAAEEHLRAVLEVSAERADAHHALGLVLDGTGRSEEARQHLSKAAELEPQNEVYRVTSESLTEQ